MPFPDLPDRLREVRTRIEAAKSSGGHGQAVAIIAVTKTHGPDAVPAACGVVLRYGGENRIEGALPKMDAVSVPIRWHLIGHLQRNKAKSVDRFAMVHSLASGRLPGALSLHAESASRSAPSPLT